MPSVDTDLASVVKTLSVVNGSAANGDAIEVIMLPAKFRERLIGAVVRTDASLGAGATVQLRLNRSGAYTVITAATTAGGASKVDDSAQAGVPLDVIDNDKIELLVGGAGITASANITVDLIFAGRAVN